MIPPQPQQQRWYPRTAGKVPPEQDLANRRTWDSLYDLRDSQNNLAAMIANINIPTIQQIANNLQLGGSIPLNITGLPGGNNVVVPLVILEDTHNNRIANFPASGYNVGVMFWETDLKVLLFNTPLSGGVHTWVPAMAEPLVLLGLPFNNNNVANNFFPAWWPNGQLAFFTDQIATVLEIVTQPLPGIANVVSGNFVGNNGSFDTRWAQYPILVNNNYYQIANVSVAGNVMTISPSIPGGNANGVVFQIVGGQWTYAAGVHRAAFGSRFPANNAVLGMLFQPTDFDANNGRGPVSRCEQVTIGNGVLPEWVYFAGEGLGSLAQMTGFTPGLFEIGTPFYERDYGHCHMWNNGWEFAPGDPGSGWVAMGDVSPHGPPTTGAGTTAGWYPCDGNNHNCVNGNGSIRSVPTQNINGRVAAFMGGGFNQNFIIGVQPSWSSDANTGAENSDQANVLLSLGTNTVPAAPHTHQFANNGSTAPINVPSEANGGLPDHFKMSAWLRA